MNFIDPSTRDMKIGFSFYLLNLFDMCATMYALEHGGMELNPLMRLVISFGMMWFVFFKVVIVAFCTILLLHLSFSRRTNSVLLFMTGMYAMLSISHLLLFWNFNV